MLIDKKGKLFGKVSIVDILIVLVVLAGVAGLGYKFTRSKTATPFTKQDEIVLECVIDEMLEQPAMDIKPGDIVKEISKGATLGKVVDVTLDKSISYANNDSGEWITSSKEGLRSVRILVEGTGRYSDVGVTFDNSEYYKNMFYTLKVGNAAAYGRITSIDKKE